MNDETATRLLSGIENFKDNQIVNAQAKTLRTLKISTDKSFADDRPVAVKAGVLRSALKQFKPTT